MSLAPPWLSVLIPAHNASAWIGQTLASITEQLDERAEIWVLDDGSTDATSAVIDRHAGTHGHTGNSHPNIAPSQPGSASSAPIHRLHHPQPRGVSAARNRLLEAARGQWLWFIDADDRIRPGAVQRIEAVVQGRPDLDVVLLDHAILRERPRLKHRLRGEGHRRSALGAGGLILGSDAILQRTLPRAQWHPWGRVVRHSAWSPDLRFPEGRVFEDLAVVPRLMARCSTAWHLAEPVVEYRSSPGSILGSIDASKLTQWHLALLDLIRSREEAVGAAQPHTRKAWDDHLAAQAVRLVRVARRRGVDAQQVRQWQSEWLWAWPALREIIAGWRWEPGRWAMAWAAAAQDWPAAQTTGDRHDSR